MAKFSLVTAATGRSVSTAEFKDFARIDDSAEDTLLASLLDDAEAEAQEFTWRKFFTQTWDVYFDGFCDTMYLRWSPVASITSVTYTDQDEASQTLSTDIYELGEVDGVAVLRRKYNQVWPIVLSHEDVVVVRSVYGYGSASSVPGRIKQAIQMHANWHYRHRGDDDSKMMNRFKAMLRPFRLQRWQKVGAY